MTTAAAMVDDRMTKQPVPDERRIDAIGYLFVAFFTVPFLLFNILPVVFGVYVSFTRWSIVGRPHWVGLENFTKAFSDRWVGIAFENALIYGLLIVPCVTVLGPDLRLVRQQALSPVRPGPHVVLRTERGLGHGDRTGLGLAARHPVRPGEPLSGLHRHRSHSVADFHAMVTGRGQHLPRSGGIWAWRSSCSSQHCRTFRPT